MDINFHALVVAGQGKAGARELFEHLVAEVVRVLHRTVRRIEAAPGDWGIDVFVGELDGVVSVWQAKFFIDGVTAAQQGEIRESFASALKAATEHGHTLDAWTLCIPVSMDPRSTKWWDGWKKRTEAKTGVLIGLWDETELRAILRSPDAAAVRDAYFGDGVAKVPLPIHPLPSPDLYDEMLFIEQLKAARIAELESAKRQFFNADLVARDVADKGVEAEIASVESVRAESHAIWETRFNAHCAGPPPDPLLPGLYAEVMQAIEQRHNSGQPLAIPLSLVHRLGSMHQVVDEGAAGWVQAWRAIVEARSG
jgi:hypothetical protein